MFYNPTERTSSICLSTEDRIALADGTATVFDFADYKVQNAVYVTATFMADEARAKMIADMNAREAS